MQKRVPLFVVYSLILFALSQTTWAQGVVAGEAWVGIYTVCSGDTLYALAKRFGTTVDELLARNQLTGTQLRIGQILSVPAQSNSLQNLGGSAPNANGLSAVVQLSMQGAAVPSSGQQNSGQQNAVPRTSMSQAQLMATQVPMPQTPTTQVTTTQVTTTQASISQNLIPQSLAPEGSGSSGPNPVLWQNYTIQSGETLYRIAINHGLSVDALKAANGLKSDQIRAGEIIRIPASAASGPISNGVVAVVQISSAPSTSGLSSTFTGSVATLIPASIVGGRAYDIAQRYIGAPYVWGGMSAEGLDCSGLTSLVFAELGVSLPRTSALQWTVGLPVEPAQLRAGDLVFFDTAGQGVSHVGIYVGGGHFIHAASTPPRVLESDLAETYWSTHYLGARRVLGPSSI